MPGRAGTEKRYGVRQQHLDCRLDVFFLSKRSWRITLKGKREVKNKKKQEASKQLYSVHCYRRESKPENHEKNSHTRKIRVAKIVRDALFQNIPQAADGSPKVNDVTVGGGGKD